MHVTRDMTKVMSRVTACDSDARQNMEDEMDGFGSDGDELDYLSSLLEDKDEGDNEETSLTKRQEEDVLFTDPIRVPKAKRRKKLTVDKKLVAKPADMDGKSKDELQAELLKMKEEMEKLKQHLASRGGGCVEASSQERHQPQSASQPTLTGNKRLAETVEDLRKLTGKQPRKTLVPSKPKAKNAEAVSRKQPETNATTTDDSGSTITDKHSGLRIRNPFLAPSEMKERMEGRKMIKLHRIPANVRDGDIEGNWVTIGVIVDKLPPKDSVKGDKYAVWRLSDLSSLAGVVSLFMFGNAYKQHWKMPVGTVIALLNPGLKKADTKGKEQVSGMAYTLSLDHPDKVMEVGQSKDFTQCKATLKSGMRRCNNFANLKDGGFCDYHVHGAYRQMQGGRAEFQLGYGPSHAGGLAKMKQSLKHEYGGYFNKPLHSEGGGGQQGSRLFAPGAREEASEATSECKQKRSQPRGPLIQKKSGVVVSEGSDLHKHLLRNQGIGARNLNRAFKADEIAKFDSDMSAMTASEVLKKQTGSLQLSLPLSARILPGSQKKTKNVLSPCLGRGLSTSKDIDLTADIMITSSSSKANALVCLQQNGPLLNRKSMSGKKQELIRKRALEGSSQVVASPINSEENVPKKVKFDLSSDEVQKVINAKSSHTWEADEEDWEQREVYFEQREKVEAMEDKMKALTEIKVNVVQCRQCDYVAEGASELCRKESHKLFRFKAVKKFFECKNCKQRTVTYNQVMPSVACRNCGSMHYQKTSMFREKKGPLLETEQLLVRGLEEKFIK